MAAGGAALLLLVAGVVVSRHRSPDVDVGLVAGGPLVDEGLPSDPFLSPGDPAETSTTAAGVVTVPVPVPGSTAEAGTPTTAATALTTSPPMTAPLPPVVLPADPNAVVLRVRRGGGYPWPGAYQREQPIELHAGGRLVRAAPSPLVDPSPAYHRLHAFQVPAAEVPALVAAAEAGGATNPPPDLGHNPMLADWGSQSFEVDRPGNRSTLVVRDLEPRSTDAPNLTADQRARRRILLGLVDRLGTAGIFVGPVRAHVRAVAVPSHTDPVVSTTVPQDLRTWPGAPLQATSGGRCVTLPADEMDRHVPGWSSATRGTWWRSGEQLLRIDFYDATVLGQGCTAPP